jgi:hypothetical protein
MVQAQVVRMVSSAIGQASVGMHDDLREAGLDSLVAVELQGSRDYVDGISPRSKVIDGVLYRMKIAICAPSVVPL